MSDSEIERQKARLAALTQEQPWLMGLSIAHVDGEVGLVLMVEQGHEAEARQLVDDNRLSVPVEVRAVLPLRIRPAGDADASRSSIDPAVIEELRRAAERRSRRPPPVA